ncbi:GAF domain-containing protein [Leuconostoc rapi]|uniref:GAF domain-containing protein n=1 Tax=Leuconostoc rapi TaxID=1406906 RepID=UPI00195A267C|nr:GAF domain-containing protein [Leuconostoc rapi]MBM7434719.1 GAF domain-containing protein [Leuconostoc rapi]
MSEKQATPLISQLLATWIEGEASQAYTITNYANAAAILFQNMRALNWVGFYLFDEVNNVMSLGPFLGKPAVALIAPNAGVVGSAFSSQQTIVVDDVNQFSGHIVCDADSNSEIVVPITTADGRQIGVLDIDSPELNRFSRQDQADLEDFVATLLPYISA